MQGQNKKNWAEPSAKDLHRHIELIYDFVTDPSGPAALIAELVQDLEFRSGTFYLENIERSKVKYFCRPGCSEEESQLYQEHFYQSDPWLPRLACMPLGHFYEGENVIPLEELECKEFYNDYCRKVDILRVVGSYLATGDDHLVRISFHHNHSQGGFNGKTWYLNQLAPHLKKAIALRQKLMQSQCQTSSITGMVDKLKVAGLIIDSTGTVRYKNAEMDKLAARNNLFRISGKRLQVPHSAQPNLDKLVHSAIKAAQGGDSAELNNRILISNPEGVATHEIEVAPMAGYDQILGLQYHHAVALVLITSLSVNRTLNDAAISETYGLTLKELQLAKQLIQGLSLNEIATESHRSINTIKTQLKSLFLKTGTNSQPKLVSRLLQIGEPLN